MNSFNQMKNLIFDGAPFSFLEVPELLYSLLDTILKNVSNFNSNATSSKYNTKVSLEVSDMRWAVNDFSRGAT